MTNDSLQWNAGYQILFACNLSLQAYLNFCTIGCPDHKVQKDHQILTHDVGTSLLDADYTSLLHLLPQLSCHQSHQQPVTEFLGTVKCFWFDMIRDVDLRSDLDIDDHLNA